MTWSRAALAAWLLGCTTPYVVDTGPDATERDAGADTASPDARIDAPDACSARCTTAGLDVCGEITACPLGCVATPSPHCAEMVISNVDEALAALVVGPDVTCAGTELIDTSACSWSHTGVSGGAVSQGDGSDAPEVCLFYVRSLTIPASARLEATGSRPLAIVAETTIRIDGELSVDSVQAGTLYRPGAGAGTGGNAGLGGVRVMTLDSGGGGGGFGGGGGTGGDVMPGVAGGAGGAPAPSVLVPLVGGASGGDATSGSGVTPGAPGGGALQLGARVSILITGYVGASGAGGLGASAGAGTGGGSGGGILMEAPTVEVTGQLNVAGGGGASGACFGTGQSGRDGADRTDRPPGGGGACGTGGRGGDGAGASSVSGDAGGSSTNNGGGGGGGAGRVRVRALSPPDLGGASLNPRFDASIHLGDTIETR
jgi:hypothetical protein